MNRLVTELSGVRATALLALYARALDNGSAHPILGDRWAEEIITRLNFDFTQFRTAKKERYGVGVRTRQMDEWTRDFVADHPDATVLDLGDGLDSRVFRVNPPSTCHWYDIDYPDVIELRNRLYSAHQRHDTIGADLTEDSWLDPLPRDRPVAIVADGVFMFLTEQELRQLLSRIVAHFPTGQIAFNAATAFQVKLANRHPAVKRAGATLQWSLDDPRALEMFHPTVKLAEERMIIESPWLSHASKAYRTTCAVMKSIPALRAQGGRILRYMF